MTGYARVWGGSDRQNSVMGRALLIEGVDYSLDREQGTITMIGSPSYQRLMCEWRLRNSADDGSWPMRSPPGTEPIRSKLADEIARLFR